MKDFIYNWFQKKLSPVTAQKEYQSNADTVKYLKQETALHVSAGLTPARLAEIYTRAEQGYLIDQANLFLDMEEKDAHIGSEMSKRKMAVKKLDWSLVPPRNPSAKERKNTQFLEDLLRDELDIGMLRLDMLDAIGHGYSCTEIAWRRNSQGLWMPDKLEHRSPTWFQIPPFEKNDLHLRDYSQPYGVPLTPFGWVVHLHQSRSGYLARTGLHRSLAWPFLYKHYSVRDLAEFLEIYGLPVRIGKYPSGTEDDQKRDLLMALLSIGHHAAGIIPDSMQMELSQVTTQGNADAFKVMMDYMDGAISKAILGATLTSGTAANGNRALGDVHNEVRMDIRDDDAKQVDDTLTRQLLYPICALNELFAPGRLPAFMSDIQEADDLALFGTAIPKLVQAGAKIPVSYINKRLKIPEPAEGEEILTFVNRTETITTDDADVPNTAEPNPAKKLAKLAVEYTTKESAIVALNSQPGRGDNPGLRDNGDIDTTPVSAMTDLLADDASKSMTAMLETITQLLSQAENLEGFRDQLLIAFGDMDISALEKVMALAFAASDLAGRFDVNEGG